MGQAVSLPAAIGGTTANEPPDFTLEIALSSSFAVDAVIKAAEAAGRSIMQIYGEQSQWDVQLKSDNSPLTLADREANRVICDELMRLTPHIPIVSEENTLLSYDVRKSLQYFWLVDPLDGTKEFIKRNGEFTVNIALVTKGRPVLGVVHVPVQNKTYWAVEGKGAWLRTGSTQVKLQASAFSLDQPGLRLVGSSSHMSAETEEFMSVLHAPQLVQVGSSLKLLMVAEGAADIYPRLAPTCEWDTAAADVIVREAGGVVLQAGLCDGSGKSLEDWKEALLREQQVVYGKENMLNPFFVVFGRKKPDALTPASKQS